MNNQGVESYVQSVLDSTFKATQEYLNQRKQNPINWLTTTININEKRLKLYEKSNCQGNKSFH